MGGGSDGVKVTPLARRVAAAHGVVLEEVRETGLLGRITRTDVLRAAGLEPSNLAAGPRGGAGASPDSPRRSAASRVSGRGGERQELTRAQQLVARRMAESKATIPHFQVQTEVDISAALALRQGLKAASADGDPVPSVNDVVVKAAALALRRHPLVNAAFKDGAFAFHEEVNVGFAVAADRGLVVPVIHSTDLKYLGQIAADARQLATAVRDQTIAPPDLARATFTVSNLGIFGMTAITPVINPPKAAILGAGRSSHAGAGGR